MTQDGSWVGKLSLDIRTGNDLTPVDGKTCDPFLEVSVEQGNKKIAHFKSKVIKKNVNPEWNEVLSVDVSKAIPGTPLTIVVECWDWNAITKSVFLGTFTKVIQPGGPFGTVETVALQPRADHANDSTKGIKGSITFAIYFESSGDLKKSLQTSLLQASISSSLDEQATSGELYAIDQNLLTVGKMQGNSTLLEVQHYKIVRSTQYTLLHKMGIPLKRVKVTINNSSIHLNTGQLHYMEGQLEMESTGGLLCFKTSISGSGVVYSEPSYGSFFPIWVQGVVYVDRGQWIAADGNLKISRSIIEGSAGMLGGEGIFQTKVEGEGWICLRCDYPPEEIQRIPLNNSQLKVDGAYSLFRMGNVDYSITFAGKGMLQKVADSTGEGKLNTFKGTGEVWVCVTESKYPELPPPPPDDDNLNTAANVAEGAGIALELIGVLASF